MIQGASLLLIERMKALGVFEEDLQEQFERSSGPGGQNVNKVATSVLLRHLPSGESIRAESSRSQQANRLEARERLCERLEIRRQSEKQSRALARRRRRLKHQPRPRKVKEKILKAKKHRSEVKKHRKYHPGE